MTSYPRVPVYESPILMLGGGQAGAAGARANQAYPALQAEQQATRAQAAQGMQGTRFVARPASAQPYIPPQAHQPAQPGAQPAAVVPPGPFSAAAGKPAGVDAASAGSLTRTARPFLAEAIGDQLPSMRACEEEIDPARQRKTGKFAKLAAVAYLYALLDEGWSQRLTSVSVLNQRRADLTGMASVHVADLQKMGVDPERYAEEMGPSVKTMISQVLPSKQEDSAASQLELIHGCSKAVNDLYEAALRADVSGDNVLPSYIRTALETLIELFTKLEQTYIFSYEPLADVVSFSELKRVHQELSSGILADHDYRMSPELVELFTESITHFRNDYWASFPVNSLVRR